MAGSRVVHHVTGSARTIRTGIGPPPVEREKLRDRATVLPAEQKIRFTSAILPRRARNPDALLCLRGASTGDYRKRRPMTLGRTA